MSDLILHTAANGILKQNANGSMPSGCNGPWNDPDTPVRNTSHWLITYIEAYRISGEEKYYNAAEAAVSYLTSEHAIPQGVSWHHRDPPKIRTNSLIGQAWTIEALTHAAEFGIEQDIKSVLMSVVDAHVFNRRVASWEAIELDGEPQGIEFTLNQQIWFAAMVSKVASLCSVSEFESRVQLFLDNLQSKIKIDGGAIYHYQSVPRKIIETYYYVFENMKQHRLPQPMLEIFRSKTRQQVYERTIGYHSFCLTGLAILAKQNPSHEIWKSEMVQTALKHAQSDEYRNKIVDNQFGFQYNVPGFEIPFAFNVFSDVVNKNYSIDEEWWVEKQLQNHYDYESYALNKSTVDPHTLSARMYEATRILDHKCCSNVCKNL